MAHIEVVFTRRQTCYLEFTQEVIEALMDTTLEEYLEERVGWELEGRIICEVME